MNTEKALKSHAVLTSHALAVELLSLPNMPVLTTDGSGEMRGAIEGPYLEDEDDIVWLHLERVQP